MERTETARFSNDSLTMPRFYCAHRLNKPNRAWRQHWTTQEVTGHSEPGRKRPRKQPCVRSIFSITSRNSGASANGLIFSRAFKIGHLWLPRQRKTLTTNLIEGQQLLIYGSGRLWNSWTESATPIWKRSQEASTGGNDLERVLQQSDVGVPSWTVGILQFPQPAVLNKFARLCIRPRKYKPRFVLAHSARS